MANRLLLRDRPLRLGRPRRAMARSPEPRTSPTSHARVQTGCRRTRAEGASRTARSRSPSPNGDRDEVRGREPGWRLLLLWTGGFPCQDLSVAGKRRGMVAGTRSNLAHAFLDLVERHRPPAIVLENVPGLLSSHGGKDLGALLGRLGELGYGWAYRVLDARHFGVPQRRRRVFIVAFGAGTGLGADGAAEVLSVGSRCRRHPPTGVEAGEDAADGAGDGADARRRPLNTGGHRHHVGSDTRDTARRRRSRETSTGRASSVHRRLTPVECERLMGWPDGWTIVTRWQQRSTAAATTAASEPNPASISSLTRRDLPELTPQTPEELKHLGAPKDLQEFVRRHSPTPSDRSQGDHKPGTKPSPSDEAA
jgi:site-specific DNA-cytosine methylase